METATGMEMLSCILISHMAEEKNIKIYIKGIKVVHQRIFQMSTNGRSQIKLYKT